jgi:hypothetical protein
MVLFEIDDEGMFRTLGVAAIVDAAITILVPVFHRLSRGDPGSGGDQVDLARLDGEIARTRARLEELEAQRAQASGEADNDFHRKSAVPLTTKAWETSGEGVK